MDGSSSNGSCPYQKRDIWTQTHREDHVTTETEKGEMRPRAQEVHARWASGLQTWETVDFCGLKHLVCGPWA